MIQTGVTACEAPSGYGVSSSEVDCDDVDAGVYPGAEEIPDDGVDQDCDGADLEADDPPEDTGDAGTEDTGGGEDTGDTGVEDTGESGGAGVPWEDEDDAGCGGCAAAAPVGWMWLVALVGVRRRAG